MLLMIFDRAVNCATCVTQAHCRRQTAASGAR